MNVLGEGVEMINYPMRLGFWLTCIHMGVSKNRGETPKMDGENNGKPYEQMDDLGGFPPIFGSTPIYELVGQIVSTNCIFLSLFSIG